MTDSDKKRLLREMLFARRFEEHCYQAYMAHHIGGFLHLYSGQEACAHGVLEAARPGRDYVITGYRDHIHAIKCGVEPRRVMAELYGKEAGCSRGRGGSMHLFDVQRRFMGGYALVGGPFPLAAGMAKAIQLRGEDAIVICFLGDAANNQGTFHESLNMASLWRLPVLYVTENNLYGIGTSVERSTAVTEQYRRACGYNIPSSQADGQDIERVHEAASGAVAHVREGNGPYLLELLTYRFRGHSMSDAGSYRPREEVEQWRLRDPITVLRERLIEERAITPDDVEAMDREIIAEIEQEIIPWCEAAPDPDPQEVERGLFAEGDPYVRGRVG